MNLLERVVETKCLLCDAHGTLYNKRFSIPPKNFLNKVINCFRENNNTHEARVYFAEFVKAACSDMNIGSLKQTIHYSIVRNIKEDVFKRATKDYIKNHKFPGIEELIKTYKNSAKNKKFIITSRHPYAEVAAEYFKADDSVTNKTIFVNGKFYGSQISIKTAKDKLKATERKLKEHNLKFEECFAIVDGEKDIPLARECAVFAASPHAKQKVRNEADFVINYIDFARRLQQEMQ